MASKINNMYLVNAPAGSGKTTKIKTMITKQIIEKPNDNILCITYTKRATDELKKDLKYKGLEVSTIHSFLNKFLKIYYCNDEIINLYFEVFGERINQSILNSDGKDNIKLQNEKYISKFQELNLEFLKRNIKNIYYNESSFDHLYYGGLSHDSLILFAEKVFLKFPKINKRLTQKYQVIFIDEYQDSSSNVLKTFYNACKNTNTKLYLLGDKMQQIYKNYNGAFEKELKTLNYDIKLEINHRSSLDIVNILNKIYNNPEFKQLPFEKNLIIKPDHKPRVIITNNLHEKVKYYHSQNPNALRLYLLNHQKFNSIGASQLYAEYNKLEKYKFPRQPGPVDVLTDNSTSNTDALLKLLFIIDEIVCNLKGSNLGIVLQIMKNHKKIFNRKYVLIDSHEKRVLISNTLKKLLGEYESECIIREFLETLQSLDLVEKNYIDAILEEYTEVLSINLKEFKSLCIYLKNPNISTQHGVKGESHDSVFFIAEDSIRTPLVYMNDFFKVWSQIDLNLAEFEEFYYEYLHYINETNILLGYRAKDFKNDEFKKHIGDIENRILTLISKFEDNILFEKICLEDYQNYLGNPIVTKFKKCFNENKVYGILSAYKLFYVGCSRARRNLTIFIEESKINDFKDKLIEKFSIIGFDIVTESNEKVNLNQ